MVELAVAAALRADRVHVFAGRRAQHLHAMIVAVGNEQPLAARRHANIARLDEFPSATALRADRVHECAVCCAKDLHSVITAICNLQQVAVGRQAQPLRKA